MQEQKCTEAEGWLVPNAPTIIREMIYKILEPSIVEAAGEKYAKANSLTAGKCEYFKLSNITSISPFNSADLIAKIVFVD